MKSTTIVTVLVFVTLATASARPARTQALSRQKRQSDQRLAELETLLALQKYGRQRFRMDRKKGVGADGEHPPGYGIIDFRMLGRKKKSTMFTPGELDNSRKQISLVADDRPGNFQEEQPNPYWTSENKNIIDSNEDSSTYPEQSKPPEQFEQPVISDTNHVGDLNQPGAVPLFYLRNK